MCCYMNMRCPFAASPTHVCVGLGIGDGLVHTIFVVRLVVSFKVDIFVFIVNYVSIGSSNII